MLSIAAMGLVRVEGVPQPERVGKRSETGKRRVMARVVKKETPPQHGQKEHATGKATKSCPLTRGTSVSTFAPPRAERWSPRWDCGMTVLSIGSSPEARGRRRNVHDREILTANSLLLR